MACIYKEKKGGGGGDDGQMACIYVAGTGVSSTTLPNAWLLQ